MATMLDIARNATIFTDTVNYTRAQATGQRLDARPQDIIPTEWNGGHEVTTWRLNVGSTTAIADAVGVNLRDWDTSGNRASRRPQLLTGVQRNMIIRLCNTEDHDDLVDIPGPLAAGTVSFDANHRLGGFQWRPSADVMTKVDAFFQRLAAATAHSCMIQVWCPGYFDEEDGVGEQFVHGVDASVATGAASLTIPAGLLPGEIFENGVSSEFLLQLGATTVSVPKTLSERAQAALGIELARGETTVSFNGPDYPLNDAVAADHATETSYAPRNQSAIAAFLSGLSDGDLVDIGIRLPQLFVAGQVRYVSGVGEESEYITTVEIEEVGWNFWTGVNDGEIGGVDFVGGGRLGVGQIRGDTRTITILLGRGADIANARRLDGRGVRITRHVRHGENGYIRVPDVFFGRVETAKISPGEITMILRRDPLIRDFDQPHWTHEDQQKYDDGFFLLKEFADKELDFLWPLYISSSGGGSGDGDGGGETPIVVPRTAGIPAALPPQWNNIPSVTLPAQVGAFTDVAAADYCRSPGGSALTFLNPVPSANADLTARLLSDGVTYRITRVRAIDKPIARVSVRLSASNPAGTSGRSFIVILLTEESETPTTPTTVNQPPEWYKNIPPTTQTDPNGIDRFNYDDYCRDADGDPITYSEPTFGTFGVATAREPRTETERGTGYDAERKNVWIIARRTRSNRNEETDITVNADDGNTNRTGRPVPYTHKYYTTGIQLPLGNIVINPIPDVVRVSGAPTTQEYVDLWDYVTAPNRADLVLTILSNSNPAITSISTQGGRYIRGVPASDYQGRERQPSATIAFRLSYTPESGYRGSADGTFKFILVPFGEAAGDVRMPQRSVFIQRPEVIQKLWPDDVAPDVVDFPPGSTIRPIRLLSEPRITIQARFRRLGAASLVFVEGGSTGRTVLRVTAGENQYYRTIRTLALPLGARPGTITGGRAGVPLSFPRYPVYMPSKNTVYTFRIRADLFWVWLPSAVRAAIGNAARARNLQPEQMVTSANGFRFDIIDSEFASNAANGAITITEGSRARVVGHSRYYLETGFIPLSAGETSAKLFVPAAYAPPSGRAYDTSVLLRALVPAPEDEGVTIPPTIPP